MSDTPAMWQPIETAPKDGSQVLAWGKDSAGIEHWGVAQWAERHPDIPRSVSGWFWPFAMQPTHWMPLPPPPENTDEPG